MNKKQSLLILLLFIVSICCFSVSKIISKNIEYYSPNEWVQKQHEFDSINITQKNPKYAISYLKNKIQHKVKNLEIDDSSFDESLNAYKINYFFVLDNSDYIYHKIAWVKIDFKINDGDYITTPKIIKLIGIKHYK